MQEAVQADASTPLSVEELLQPFSRPEEQAVRDVLQELHETKIFIQKNLKFPADLQDRKEAGVIFGRLMPLMYEYERLRKHNVPAAQVAGVAIVQEEFVSKDGHKFYLPVFIKQYVQLVQNPSFPKDSRDPLIDEFTAFREHILQDRESLK